MTKEKFIDKNWNDPDDAPKLTQDWVDGADVFEGGKLSTEGVQN